jgi:hypothetical protein
MSQPSNSPPPFDPIAQQAAAFADTLDRVGTVHVESPPPPAKPSRAIATGTSSDDALHDDSWQGADPLCEQVDASDNAAVIRDPEIGHEPPSVVVGNSPPQPVQATIEREPFDPNAGYVDHVDATAHMKDRQPSTDRFAGVSFDPTGQDR